MNEQTVRSETDKFVSTSIERVGFDLEETSAAFLEDAAGLPANLRGWLYRRGKHSDPAPNRFDQPLNKGTGGGGSQGISG